jgi:hypothetical protein
MERRGWIKSALAALAGLPLIGRLSAASEPSLPTLADEIARLPQNAYLVEWPFKPGDGIRASLYEGIVTLHRKTGKRAEAVLVGAADAAILATDHVGFPGQTPFGVVAPGVIAEIRMVAFEYRAGYLLFRHGRADRPRKIHPVVTMDEARTHLRSQWNVAIISDEVQKGA